MAITQITEKGIKDGEILNADINASAAIAKSKLASLDIVNADVNASAAIAGTKISPDFGSQNVVSTGTSNALGTTTIKGGSNAAARLLLQNTSSVRTNYIGLSGDDDRIVIAADEADQGSNSTIDFKVDGTERMRIDASGTIVTGAATSPTSSDTGNVYIKPGSTIGSAGLALNITSNAVFNSSWKAIATGATGILSIDSSGGLSYRTDNSTNAGADFTLERRFAIAEGGKTLLANDTSVAGNASLTGARSRVQITGPSAITSFSLDNSYLHIGGAETNANQLQTISFGHVKPTATHVPAYIGLKTIDSASHENGQIEIATRDVTTDTAPTPSVIIRPSKQLVVRGPSYGIWRESVQTPDGGARDTQFIEDCYGQWVVVAKIHEVQQFKESMSSTATISTTNDDATTTEWSSNWGNTKPSAVRYISASDWNYWRETRVLDWMTGVPHNRPWKEFYTDGQVSGMRASIDGNKLGWTCNGAWDGFGRWRNPQFEKWRCTDPGQGDPSISRDFFTTAGSTMDWDTGNTDAKVGCHWKDTVGGQDDHVSTGYGWDDNNFGRIDNFPSITDTNMGGTDVAEHGLWILINLDGPEVSHQKVWTYPPWHCLMRM